MPTDAPPYLSRLVIPYRPSRVLGSPFSSSLLRVLRSNLTFGSHSPFSCLNYLKLPESIRSHDTCPGSAFLKQLSVPLSPLGANSSPSDSRDPSD